MVDTGRIAFAEMETLMEKTVEQTGKGIEVKSQTVRNTLWQNDCWNYYFLSNLNSFFFYFSQCAGILVYSIPFLTLFKGLCLGLNNSLLGWSQWMSQKQT